MSPWMVVMLAFNILINGWLLYKQHNPVTVILAWGALAMNAYVVLSLLHTVLTGD